MFDEGEKNENARISKLPSSYGADFLPRVLLDPNENGSTIPEAESKFIQHLFYHYLINLYEFAIIRIRFLADGRSSSKENGKHHHRRSIEIYPARQKKRTLLK